MKLKGSKSRN